MESTIYLEHSMIDSFCEELYRRERSVGTIKQYYCTLSQLWEYLPEEKMLNKDCLLDWKKAMANSKAVRTVNCMIAAVNAFLEFVDATHLKLRSLKCQRSVFSENELTQEEFQALVEQARREKDEQTVMLLQAMSATGVRVSEVQFLTVEAAKQRMATIRLKGKTRQIPLGDKLCVGLLNYAKKKHIQTGALFVGKQGRPLDRRRIWEKMKHLCIGAGVEPEKAHPHALRHLFARIFYDLTQDIAKLADLLGHGSIETTRIYIMTSIREHRTILDHLIGYLNTKKPPLKGGYSAIRT